jgi:hypothetical protein
MFVVIQRSYLLKLKFASYYPVSDTTSESFIKRETTSEKVSVNPPLSLSQYRHHKSTLPLFVSNTMRTMKTLEGISFNLKEDDTGMKCPKILSKPNGMHKVRV